MDPSEKANRIEWIDCAKGLGILFVILGHAITAGGLSHFIHSFHMPLFFIISGFLFSGAAVKTWDYVKRKAKSLLVPYLFFGLSTYAVWVVVNLIGLTTYDVTDFFSPLHHLFWINTTGLKISGEFWFLTALFFASVIFFLLHKYVKSRVLFAISAAVIALIGCFFRSAFDIQLPWALLPAFVGVGSMLIGYALKQCQSSRVGARLLNLKWYELLVLAAAAIALIFLNGEVNMRRSVYSIVPLFWIGAASMTLIIFNISRLITAGKPGSFIVKLTGILKNIGKDSIIYVCLDSMVLKALSAVERRLFSLPSQLLWQIALGIANVLLTIVIIYLINILVQKTKLKVLLGK